MAGPQLKGIKRQLFLSFGNEMINIRMYFAGCFQRPVWNFSNHWGWKYCWFLCTARVSGTRLALSAWKRASFLTCAAATKLCPSRRAHSVYNTDLSNAADWCRSVMIVKICEPRCRETWHSIFFNPVILAGPTNHVMYSMRNLNPYPPEFRNSIPHLTSNLANPSSKFSELGIQNDF